MQNKKDIKFIDLFAGIGGFHSAFHELGCECVFASEIDESARITYERNHYSSSPNMFDKGLFNDDIRNISVEEIPDFDILCAGFPCQPFSQAGYKQGFSDSRDSERGNLFFNIVDILAAKKPKAFFLENVRGIVNHDSGKTFRIIREILEEELGYSFYFKVVKATDYGLPQHRPRAFMIGFRDEGFLKSFTFPPNIPLKFNMSDVFGGVCSREIGFTLRVGGAGSNINDRRNWDSYLVDNEVVRIQPHHALKIQGFPDNFLLPNSKRQAMKQLGNSVAVDAIKACASEIIEHLKVIDNREKVPNLHYRKRNKGEWTELYTFLKLIVDKKISLGDENLNPTKEEFKVHKITTLNIEEEVIFENKNIVVKNQDRQNIINKVISNEDILNIRDEIKNGKKTFDIQQVNDIFQNLGIEIINGGTSSQKSDIILDVSHNGRMFEKEGFGIKSYLGAKPTLLNASGSNTNFVYEIKKFDDEKLKKINKITTNSKIKDRLQAIYEMGFELEFKRIEADTMQYNLQVLDKELPSLLSKMLLQYYEKRTNNLEGNLKEIYLSKTEMKHGFLDLLGYQIKIKRFIIAVLLGMFSGKKWNGDFLSNGTIVVKSDGSQIAFHIIKKDILEKFLFTNVKFDTPSTTRHRFGSVYKERDGKFYIKLNMQIRF